ncbi:MAG: hypothetical protein LBE82_13045 [Chitinophagaceae bacterium]|jgi:hypothetical protein|nr:hypothetical protein [Chitinophagaceae bacterium]
MERRTFVGSAFLAGSSLLAGGAANAAIKPKQENNKPFNLYYAIHD